MQVDIVVNNDPINVSAKVANRAGGVSGQVVHDKTLTGNGNDIPLGVNKDLIATKTELEEGLELKQDKGDYALVDDIPSLEGYVKNTDVATKTKAGLVYPIMNAGLTVSSSGGMYTEKATKDNIDNRLSDYKPITPTNLDYAVKTSVTTNTIQLTEEEKTNAKAWLGYVDNTDIMQAIASIPQFKLSIVQELPETGEAKTLYLVPKDGSDNDVYSEYLWLEQTGKFEFLGTTAVDLTDYVKKTDVATSKEYGVVKVSGQYGVGHNTNVGLFVVGATESQITAKSSTNYPISVNKLDYAIKVGLTTNKETLTDEEKVTACNWLGTNKTVSITEADYEALETKDTNTLYLIEEE